MHAQAGNLPSRTLGWCWMLLFIPLARAAAPTIVSSSLPVLHHEVNTTLTLTCTAQNLIVAWYYENTPLAAGGSDNTLRHRIIGDQLEIPNLDLQRTGWYTCAASNQFGRAERDFLVVVGGRPRITLQYQTGSIITVEAMTRVEIPCVANGTPYPEPRWFDDTHEIIDGSSDGRYRIDYTTNSLVIYNFTSADVQQQGFFCNVSNSFGTTPSSSVRVEVVTNERSPNLQSPFNDLPSAVAVTTNVVESLNCTGLSLMDIQNLNLQFIWTRNFNQFPSTSNSILLDGSNPETTGYYCCEVSQLINGTSTSLNTYCATVFVRYEPQFDTVSVNTSVQAGRSVNLHCKANTLNRFNPPNLTWTDRNGVRLEPGTNGSITVSQNSLVMSYLSVAGTRVEDTGNYTCSADFAARVHRSIAVRVVDNSTCSNNVLRDHNAEEEDDPLSSWSLSGTGANFTTINNERVFAVSYNSSETEYPGLVQTVDVPSNATSAYVSGRMRHTDTLMATPMSSLGVGVINVSLDGGLEGVLEQPFPSLTSWQWVGGSYNVTGSRNMSVVLTVGRGEGEDHIQGTAYFDDLCISFLTEPVTTSEPPPPGGLTTTQLIAIAAGGGAGLLIVFFVLLLLCIYCCCGKSSKGAAKPMRKMSTVIKKKFRKPRDKSDAETCTAVAYKQKPEVAGENPIYDEVSAGPSPIYSEDHYVQPYVSVEVETPIYTPLDPDLLEGEHQYISATPHTSSSNLAVDGDSMEAGEYLNVSHESQSALLASGDGSRQGREYLKVQHGSQASNQYLELLTSSPPSHPQKHSSVDPVTGEIYSYVNEGQL